jgi:hypothetical protein
MKKILLLWLLQGVVAPSIAQHTKLWTETDRAYLLDHLTRSRDELMEETKSLSEAQWNFKEAPERWTIKEVVEHIAIWELLFQREITIAFTAGPQPELLKSAPLDSKVLEFILEEKPHVSLDYTQPFTYSLPMGLNTGDINLTWYNKLRNECINHVQNTDDDLRLYFMKEGRGNIHQVYINVFGHTDRHLRQIRKIKQHPKYPVNTKLRTAGK